MAASVKLLLLLVCLLFSFAGMWVPDPQSGKTWTNEVGVKWSASSDVYDTTPLAPPESGLYRSANDFLIPEGWPLWVAEGFLSLSQTPLPRKLENLKTWDRGQLLTNTKWVDATSDNVKGYISVQVPTYKYFTFVTVEPNDGVIDQDFKGNAKIFGLADDKTYRVYAWDSDGLLGQLTTAISDKYIHVLDPFQYPHVVAQKVVEDPNRRLWVSVFEPYGIGSSYYFASVYAVTAEGDIEKRIRLPMTSTYINTWLTDLILEDDGDATVSVAELITPTIASTSAGSYVARVDRSGATEWQFTSSNVSALAIAKLTGTTGYVFTGVGSLGGVLYRLDDSGNSGAWGTGGNSVYSGSINMSVVREISEFNSGLGVTTYPTSIVSTGKTCATDLTGACGNVFDENDTTYVEADSGAERYAYVDLGSAKDIPQFRILAGMILVANATFTMYLDYSDDGSSWTNCPYLGNAYFYSQTLSGAFPGTTHTIDETYTFSDDYGSHRYWKLRAELTSAGTQAFKVYTLNLTGYGTPVYSSTSESFYTAGLNGTIDQSDLTDTDGSVGGTGTDVAYAFDNDWNTSTYALIDAGQTVTWTFTSAKAVIGALVFGYHSQGYVYLEYYNGISWVTTGSFFINSLEQSVRYISASNPVASTQHRIRNSGPGSYSLYEAVLYGTDFLPSGDGIIAKWYSMPPAASGTTEWQTVFNGSDCPVSGYFLTITQSKKNGDVVAAGYNVADNGNLGNNSAYVACVDYLTGVSKWQRLYSQMSIAYGISATDDGGYLIAGTKYTGTAIQERSAVLLKIDANGNVDSKFPQTFKDPSMLGADGRDAIATRDGGILMVGGYSDDSNSSRAALIKLDKFNRSCSNGIPCE